MTRNDDFDQDAFEDLDDFESEDFEDDDDADRDDSYLRGMWGNYSFRRSSGDAGLLADAVTAHGMVQSFVNSFARDGHYVVSFDPSTSTAGTDSNARRVVITPAPIADPDITAEEAGLILTGLAVHEVSHPRYGRNTWAAVTAVFPGNAVASRISNLLDDVRIERRFVADYPGYATVFEPTLAYIGKGAVAKNGGKLVRPSLSDLLGLAVMAIRYPTFADWTPELEAERKWWTDWAERGSREDAPKRHVAAVREALQHIVASQAKAPKAPESQAAPSGQPEQGGASSQGLGEDDEDQAPQVGSPASSTGDESDAQDTPEATQGAGTGTGDDDTTSDHGAGSETGQDEPELSDEDLNAATKDLPDQTPAPTCSGSDAIDQAAHSQGIDQQDAKDLKAQADKAVESAANIEGDGHGRTVDVARSTYRLVHGGGSRGRHSELAARYIRNAILRSRTGSTERTPHQVAGRLDQRNIARIGYGDTRLFERRKAPSPGRYLVWVMIDASSSMEGRPIIQASEVAHAIASATTGTPSVRMAVWAWSNPFRPSMADAGVAKAWETGQDADLIFRVAGLNTGGTPDGTVLGWATKAIKREARPDETPVIIFASDGAGEPTMTQRVAEARRAGIEVYGVSLGYGMPEAALLERYGKGNYVAWAGSMLRTAKPLAALFAKITSGR